MFSCLPWSFQHLCHNRNVHRSSWKKSFGFWITVCDISKNVILWQRCLQRKTNVCFWNVFVIFWMQCFILREMQGILHFVCAYVGFVCKVLKQRGKVNKKRDVIPMYHQERVVLHYNPWMKPLQSHSKGNIHQGSNCRRGRPYVTSVTLPAMTHLVHTHTARTLYIWKCEEILEKCVQCTYSSIWCFPLSDTYPHTC